MALVHARAYHTFAGVPYPVALESAASVLVAAAAVAS